MKFNLNIEDIKYVKILYANSDGNPTTTKGGLKRIDEREMTACIKFEEEFRIKTPQEVTLSIICNEGLYRTKTKLKSFSCEVPYIFLYMETPAGLEFEQNREYFRVPLKYMCSYHVNNNGQPAVFTSETFDISGNGVSIIMPVHIFSEEDAKIEIKLGDRIVNADIRYVRSERIPEGYKLSFMYTNISEHDRDCIAQACIKKQLEQKRNSRA